MPLRLKVKGATKEELARGAAAAVAFLQMHGVTPEQAYDGHWEALHADIPGMPEGSIQFGECEQRWARLWLEAGGVAIRACCRGWDEIPLFGNLDMYPDDPPLH
jgi:hypothetical protein